MSLPIYKLLHLLGVFFLFASLGGTVLLQLRSGTVVEDRAHKLSGMTHGFALLLMLVAGFGALTKLGAGFPLWAVGKLVIWLLMGAMLVIIRRLPAFAPVLWWIIPLLGVAAAYLAVYKPGA